MKRWQWVSALCVVSCAAVCAAVAPHAEALVLRGQFPIHNGMFWDFSDNATQHKHAWAVLGRFSRPDSGSLIVFARQGQGFLALKEEWDGLYLHGEYRIDGFTLPDRPVMFLPFEIDFDKPLRSFAHMRVYSAGEDARQVAEYDYSVHIELRSLEDVVLDGREIRNCSVLVKKSKGQGGETTETFWLAPTVGPVKIRIEGFGVSQTSILQNYGTHRGTAVKELTLDDYFPLTPERAYDYRNRSGELKTVTFGAREERFGRETVPYTEPGGDVFYLSWQKQGLTVQLKYVSSMGFAFITLPPDRVPVLLPSRSAVGQLNHSLSYVRSSQWPSLQPMLDFYPEIETSSVIVGIEDVTVPAGTYRDCIKLCVSSLGRSFAMQREKIRTGFVWLARGVGEVKREGVSLANTYLEATPDYVFQTECRELVGIRRVEFQRTADSAAQNVSRGEGRLSVYDLQWQGNSKDMVDKAVAGAPFFVRRLVRRSLMDAVIERADSSGRVTENAVIDAVRATTPEKLRDKVSADLEQMKSR